MPTNVLILLMLLHPFPISSPLVVRQGPDDINTKLHTRAKDFAISADNFLDALTKVAKRFQLPMGIEWGADDETNRPVTGTWSDADAQQIIEELVSAQHGYRWNVNHGVVHVFAAAIESNQNDFVNLKLPKFVVHEQYPAAATDQLREFVKLTVSPPPQTGLTAGGTAGSHLGSGDDQQRQISFKLENITVRDALDQIALVSDYKLWVVTFTDESALTPTGFRRTRTLWNETPVPDNEQPVWNTFRWVDAMPSTTH